MLLPNRTRAGWLSRAAGRPAAMPHLMPYFRVQSHLSPPSPGRHARGPDLGAAIQTGILARGSR
jgi:hypothetical protein